MTDASPPSDPGATGQALTPAQLRHILAAHYPGPGGRLDTHAAAAGLGVSERTIRRWTSDTTTTGYTEAQVQRRIGPLLPSALVLNDEANRLERDVEGIGWLKKDRSRVPVLWRNNGWLKPFHVYLVALPRYGVCTVRITAKAELINGRDGSVVEHLVFPTRIHAEAHVLAMLAQLRPWRLVAPEWWKLAAPTRCWLVTAPDSALRTLHEAYVTSERQ